MPYVRIALTQAKEHQEAEVRRIHEELLRYDRGLPGFIEGYLLHDPDGGERTGRLTLWQQRSDADQAAQQQHTLTVRSELTRLIRNEPSAHFEVGIEADRV